MNYIQRELDIFTSLPLVQWKRVTLPDNLFPLNLKAFNNVEQINISSAVAYDLKALLIGDLDDNFKDKEVIFDYLDIDKAHKESLGDKFLSYVNSQFNHGLFIHISDNTPKNLVLEYRLDDQNPILVDHHVLLVEAGASVDLVLDYTSLESGAFHHYGNLKVIAKEGAKVNVTKLQRLNDESTSFDQVFTHVSEGASITVNDAQVGASVKAIANIQNVVGFRGDAVTHSLYYGQPTSHIDVSYTMKHIAKKTTSTILSKGALQQESKKVFRGNLVFERGATGSVGKEEEFVILLSEKVKSDSIPGLFCKEDDVIGEHAASVGQVDPNKLFYIMSRGFTELEARKLIIKSGFEEVLQKMSIGDYAKRVIDDLDKRIGYGS